jgi:hypothetical protein
MKNLSPITRNYTSWQKNGARKPRITLFIIGHLREDSKREEEKHEENLYILSMMLDFARWKYFNFLSSF